MDYSRFWDIVEAHSPNYIYIFEADGTCPPPHWPEDSEWVTTEKNRRHESENHELLEHRNMMGDEAVKTWNAQGWHAICMGTTWNGYLGPRFLNAFEKALNSAPIGRFVTTPVERDWCVVLATENADDVERFRHLERKATCRSN